MNVNPDKPIFKEPILEGKATSVFAAYWQKWIAFLWEALRVIDGGSP